MTNDNVEQLTQEESEVIAKDLGHFIIGSVMRYCRELGIPLADKNTRLMVKAVLLSLAATVPQEEISVDSAPPSTWNKT